MFPSVAEYSLFKAMWHFSGMFVKNMCRLNQLMFPVNSTHSQNQYRHWRPGYLTGADNQSSMRFMGGVLANRGRRMLTDWNFWYTDVLQKCKIPVCVWMCRRRVAFNLSSTLHHQSSSIRPAVDKNQERNHPIVMGRKPANKQRCEFYLAATWEPTKCQENPAAF